MNRELCFLVRAECQCAAMCIRSSGSRVGHVFGYRRERESEVIASKRERELRSMAGRESRPRERVCIVSHSLQEGVTVLNITEFDFQKFKSDS